MTLPTLSVDSRIRGHLAADCGPTDCVCTRRGQGYNANRGSKEEFMFFSGSITIGSSYHTKGLEK